MSETIFLYLLFLLVLVVSFLLLSTLGFGLLLGIVLLCGAGASRPGVAPKESSSERRPRHRNRTRDYFDDSVN